MRVKRKSVRWCHAGVYFGQMIKIEVSLTDRGNFTYPLLIGAVRLSDFAIVDPGHAFLGNDGCRELLAQAPPVATS